MLDSDYLKKLLIDDAAFDYNWSEMDSEGYDGDTEEFLNKFNNNLHFESTDNKNNDDFQFSTDSDGLNKKNENNGEVLTGTGVESRNSAMEAVKSIIDCFLSFFDEKILTFVVNCTNSNIARVRKSYSRSRDCLDTNVDEIKVLIGLLILAGLLKFDLKIDDMWEKGGIGVEFFRLSMNLTRFKFSLRYVHITSFNKNKVDNPDDSKKIIEVFRQNCKRNYKCGQSITINRKILTKKMIQTKCRVK